MRIIFAILLLFILSCHTISAQQKLSADFNNKPIIELFQYIERETDIDIYYSPEEMDTIIVNINFYEKEPRTILQEALKHTKFQISQFKNAFFIKKDTKFIAELPDNFYNTKQTYTELHTRSLQENSDSKATSEIKVYTIGTPTMAQPASVRLTGTLTDFKTGEPIPAVSISIDNPATATKTNASGFYSIELPTGRHELKIQGMGVKNTKRQLMLYSDGKLDIELEEIVHTLQEISITSDRIDNVRATRIGVERITIQSVKNIPTIFGETDISRIILSLPGVKSVGEISTGFNVRGGSTDQNLILYNEGTIYNSTHLFGLFSAFNSDVVKDMELYKSSIPAKYGGRISSVLDINSREGNRDKFSGSASIGLLTSRVTLEGPLFSKKTSFIVGLRTTYSDWLLKLIPESSEYNNGSAGFYDLNGILTHRFNEKNSISINTYYSKDRFSFNENEQYAYNNTNVSVKWKHIFSDELVSSLAAGYDHYGYDIENSENQASAYSLGFSVNQVFAKVDFNYFLNNHMLNFGINTIKYNLNPGNYLPLGKESLVAKDKIQKENALESAIYIGDEWEFTYNFSINIGLRYSVFNAIGPRVYNIYQSGSLPSINTIQESKSADGIFKTYHGPEFRFSLRYILRDGLSIKAGFNTMRQYIHKISNTTIMSPTDTWKLSDVNIQPQTGFQTAMGIFKNFNNNAIETSLEFYYKTMSNYLDYRNGAELFMNHHIETEVTGAKGKAYGAEIMLRKPQGAINGWVSYTYSRVLLTHEDSSSRNKKQKYPADFDKPHEFKFVGNYKFTHRYSLSLNCDYSTGRPITLPVAKFEYVNGQYVYYTERNKYRIPDFFRMDLAFNIGYGHRLTKLTHSTLSLGIYNLTGRKNAYSVFYKYENGKLNGYQLSIFGVPIPYVSYNIKF